MAYSILELESLPKESKKLQALINEHRYRWKRRRRILYGLALALAALFVLWFAGLPVYTITAICSAVVLLVSLARLALRRRRVTT